MKAKWDMEKIHKMIPPVPHDFTDWARDRFQGGYNIYVGKIEIFDGMGYSTKGRMAYCQCCQEWFDASNDIKVGQYSMCPICSSYGPTHSANRKQNATKLYQTMWLGQNIGEGIFLLRGFRVEFLQWSPIFRGMDDTKWEIELYEGRRLYIGPKEWYTEYSTWMQKNGKWIRGWIHAAGENTNSNGPVYPGTYESIKGTGAEYSCLDLAEAAGLYSVEETYNSSWGVIPWHSASIWDYLKTYAQDRKIEMLMKMNMAELVGRKMNGQSINHNYRAKNPWDYLRVWKPRLKNIGDHIQQYKNLAIYQMERKMGQHWTEQETEIVLAAYSKIRDFERILQYMSLTQFVNRVKTYEIRNKKMDRQHIITTYMDYLDMKARLGFNMTNSIYQFPKNLAAAHDRASSDLNSKNTDKQNQIMERCYKNIRKRFEKANKIYTWSKDSLMIRPAASASEIMNEGRFLHHCVGSPAYLSSHNEGRSIILFIRKKNKKDEPYITVQVGCDGHIQQWYGKCDTKPSPKKIDKWLEEYIATLDKKAVVREMRAQKKGAAS